MSVNVAVLSSIIFTYLIMTACYCNINIEVNDEGSPERSDLKSVGYEIWCKFQPNSFDCGGKAGESRFYYDMKMQGCKSFKFGFCPNSYNNFKVLNDCYDACIDNGPAKINFNLTENVACRLQPEFGNCHDYIPMYYFDIGQRACRGFPYSGCGGNRNRFTTSKLCQGACGKTTEF